MDIKINSTRSAYEIYRVRNAGAISKPEKNNKTDSLTFSNQAKDFQQAMKALRDVPDIRQDKVESIQSKMSQGEYNITSMDVAGKLLGLI